MKVLITGASSGMGRDMATILSQRGYDLVLVARRKDRLEELAKQLKTKVEIEVLDLSIQENCFKLFTKYKDIDILINNAGFGLFGFFNDTDIEKELQMINLNIKTVHILTKLYLQEMMTNNKGYILNVASSAGFLAGPRLNTYDATKNYVLKLTMAIYQELKEQKSNVSISALCPGPVDTEFNKVAHGGFSVKPLKSMDVANYAINKMFKKKLIIVPGLTVKLGVFFNRFLPYKSSLRITSKIQQKKQK